MDVAVVVATFGAPSWHETKRPAVESAQLEDPADLVSYHGGANLAEARNTAAGMTSAEWLCFLDGDDQLEPGYLEAMAEVDLERGLLAPAIRYVEGDHVPEPITLEARNMRTLNPCVIGTLIRREIFDEVGGFWNERGWEDWSLFRRAWLLEEPVVHVPGAVYRANVNPQGRNNVTAPRQLHRQILASHGRWSRRRKAARR